MHDTVPSSGSAVADKPFKHDLVASVVVFLVALPLCMGIALASGVPPEKSAAVGIITGVIGGIVVGALAGSPLLITGPAAGLSVIVYELIQRHGWEKLGLIVLMAGAFQLTAGLFRLGQWFRAVSPAVIHGMLAGIGVLIFASQLHIMLDDAPRASGLENLVSVPEAIWRGLVPTHDASHDDAARIGIVTIVILVLWPRLVPKRFKVLPAPLVAIVVAALLTALLDLPIKQVALPENLATAITWPDWSGLSTLADWQPLLVAAASIAFIASAETLLSAAAVDQMHQGTRTRYDKELVAQGVGNMTSGLLGGLPMTGVIVRSAANVEAGARSSWSEILHGVWLLVFVCLFPFLLRFIPTASLAAILVFTGWKLMAPKMVRTLWKFGKGEVIVYAGTVVFIVASDLLTGVLVGVALATIKLLATFSHLDVIVKDDAEQKRTVLWLEGTATFFRLPKLAAALEAVPADRELHVHFEHLAYIDHACLDLFMNWEKQHEAAGGTLVLDWDSLTARFRDYRNNEARGSARTTAAGVSHGNGAQDAQGRFPESAEVGHTIKMESGRGTMV